LEKLIISMMRFSTAVTLFGLEQLESAMNSMGGGDDLSNTMDRFRKNLDSFTDLLSKEIDPKKRETLKSVINMSEEAVHRTMEGMNVVDPREVMRATSDLLKKTSNSVAEMVTRTAETAERTIEATEPEAAADALSKKRHTSHSHR
jgi:chemotaxis regulatin CheY-phosphate phosphatase CheZ